MEWNMEYGTDGIWNDKISRGVLDLKYSVTEAFYTSTILCMEKLIINPFTQRANYIGIILKLAHEILINCKSHMLNPKDSMHACM